MKCKLRRNAFDLKRDPLARSYLAGKTSGASWELQ
jgi:hypothetical protein